MPNIRVMLWAALAAILFLGYEAWMQDYPASPAPGSSIPGALPTAGGGSAPASRLGDSVPQAAAPSTASPAGAKVEPPAATPGGAAPLGGAATPTAADAESAGADHSPG